MLSVADLSSVPQGKEPFTPADWLARAERELALALRHADATDSDIRVTVWLRGGLYSVRMARRALAEAVPA